MRIVLRTLAVFLVLAGAIWSLQGIGVLPGSFMTGQLEWTVYGAIAICFGSALWVFARRWA